MGMGVRMQGGGGETGRGRVWGGGEVRFVKFELWGISVIKFTWTPRLVQWLREALLSPQEAAYNACKYLGQPFVVFGSSQKVRML